MKECKVYYIRIASQYADVYLKSFDRETCEFTTTKFCDSALTFRTEVEAARFCNEFSKKLSYDLTLYYELALILIP